MTMNTSITSSVTDGQKKQVKRFAEDAIDRAFAEGVLDKDGIQKLIENGDEFQADILASIRKLSVSNQFADEEVQSNYTYPPEYTGPKPIEDQIKALQKSLAENNEKVAALDVMIRDAGAKQDTVALQAQISALDQTNQKIAGNAARLTVPSSFMASAVTLAVSGTCFTHTILS